MHRKAYIDWARGVAVLLMIWAHTTDAWTRLNVRRTIAFRDANVLGGFAAPLFLWLAGLAVVLAATRSAQRSGSRGRAVEAICRRGLEIFILGFLFRLQGFIVTPGSHPVTLFRVDILNIMGPAIVGAGIVWGLAGTTTARVLWYAVIASAMAVLTPVVRASSAVDAVPLWFQWYIRPAGEFTIFTVFPWAAFVFAGGAVGALIAAAKDDRSERRLQIVLAAVGVTLIVIGFYTAGRPSVYTSSSFWTSSPTWFAIRLGILTIALSAIYACEAAYVTLNRRAARRSAGLSGPRSFATLKGSRHIEMNESRHIDESRHIEMRQSRQIEGKRSRDIDVRSAPGHLAAATIDPLARLGRNSLFIYWIHVELVYGYASWGWRHRLPLWGSAIAFVLFSVLMYRAIGWRDQLIGKWRRRKVGDGLQAVPFGGTA